jgi:hypothetical protein
MASTDREREKIQSSQNMVKMTSSRRVCRNLSNEASDLSNEVTDQKDNHGQSLLNLAQSAGG